jgi:acylpyruvate hydrolase
MLDGKATLGIREDSRIRVLGTEPIESLLAIGIDLVEYGRTPGTVWVDPDVVALLTPLSRPPKTFCIGLNYADHTAESVYEQPDHPRRARQHHGLL